MNSFALTKCLFVYRCLKNVLENLIYFTHKKKEKKQRDNQVKTMEVFVFTHQNLELYLTSYINLSIMLWTQIIFKKCKREKIGSKTYH